MIKEIISYVIAIASLACGFVLMFFGYFAPPEGEIDPSVLYAFGEISIFTGSVLGISIHYSNFAGHPRHRNGTEPGDNPGK